MYFSEETKKEYNLLKNQREILVAWDKYRNKLEENQNKAVKELIDEENVLIQDSKKFIEENTPKLKRPKMSTYFKKNLFIFLSVVAFFVGFLVLKDINVYLYHGVALALPIVFMILSMVLYRLDLIKNKDKGRIYKPIIDYFFIIVISVPVMFLIGKFLKINKHEYLQVLVLFPIVFDILYVLVGKAKWNMSTDKCRLNENEINEKIKELEVKREDIILEGKLEYKNKENEYFSSEEDIYLPTFTKGEDVEKLLLYFDQGRAETIKEAITIFFEEKRVDEIKEMLDKLIVKVDDMAVTEQELQTEMRNTRLATINQLGGVKEAIVGTIKHDRMSKMTSTQKKNYEKKMEKTAQAEKKKEMKKALKESQKLEKNEEIERKKQEEIEKAALREERIIAKREEKIKKELEKKKVEQEEKEVENEE